MSELLDIEWDEGISVVRSSRHTALVREYTCAWCGGTVKIGDGYRQTIALVPEMKMGKNAPYYVNRLGREIVCDECETMHYLESILD
jgi:hypothetical protein